MHEGARLLNVDEEDPLSCTDDDEMTPMVASQSKRPKKSFRRSRLLFVVFAAGALLAVYKFMPVSSMISMQEPAAATELAVVPAANPCAPAVPNPCSLATGPGSGNSPKGAAASAAQAPDILEPLEHILKEAARVESTDTHNGARLLTPDDTSSAVVLKELEKVMLEGSYEEDMKVVKKNRKVILEAIEEVSEEQEPAQAREAGTLVSSELLQAVNGIDSSPEQAPQDMKKGNDVIEGDMCLEPNTGAGRKLDAKTGRRLWAGTPWSNKGDIPYCFHKSISSKAKRAFLHAVDHFTSLLPCMRFREVAVREYNGDDSKCTTAGIFVQSHQGGCFAYVGQPWMMNGAQRGRSLLNLGQYCETMGIAAHELGHSVGMAHEQARPDYSENVQIYWQNIKRAEWSQYEVSKDSDVSVPYDIMSLMHYGDTDFNTGGDAKTMKSIGHSRGIMGNRMGLSKYDALQLARMYSCDYNKKTLCTNDPNGCTTAECVCHQDPGASEPIIKTFSGQCARCLKSCPTNGYCKPKGCGCGAGFKVKRCNIASGEWYQCVPASAPVDDRRRRSRRRSIVPVPTARRRDRRRATTPPPAPSPSCKFPTDVENCAHSKMPGCTTCDGDNPWCFTKGGTGGDWKYCKKEDNACLIPFEYEGKKHYKCTLAGDTKHWCYKVGGSWKYCSEADGHAPPKPIPTPAPPPPPTPAPVPDGCKFPWYMSASRPLVNGCVHYKSHNKAYCKDDSNNWKVCHKNDNLCEFPFTYGGVENWACRSYLGRSWCNVVGGGYKWC